MGLGTRLPLPRLAEIQKQQQMACKFYILKVTIGLFLQQRQDCVCLGHLFSSVDQATTGIIKTNFRCNVQNIQLVPCREQVGGSDWGPFAIAIATSIVFGEDPTVKCIYASHQNCQ